MERFNGLLEGKQKGLDDIDFTNPNETRYNIEKLPLFRERIYDFWDDIIKNYQGQNILVVAHAGVGIYTQCYFNGEPKENDYSKYKIKNCDVLKFSNSKY